MYIPCRESRYAGCGNNSNLLYIDNKGVFEKYLEYAVNPLDMLMTYLGVHIRINY